MKVELGQLGSGGLIEDVKPFDLPPNIFNDCLNFEFNGFVIRPEVEMTQALVPIPDGKVALAAIQGWVNGGLFVYVAACADSIWLWYMNEWFDVSPVDLRPTNDWHLFTFNGYVILNSPDNVPYHLDPFDFHKPMEKVPSWPESLKTKFLIGYNGFLIGLGLTSTNGYFDQQLIFWSDIAEQGTLPSNFGFDDPTSRAGFTTVADNEQFICAVELQNTIVIYREYSIYSLRFVGGNAVFAIERKLRNSSPLNRKCVVEVDNMHFFIGKDGMYFFDGFRTQPVGEGQIVRSFFQQLDANEAKTVSVQLDADSQRIYILYPTDGSVLADMAYVFKYKLSLFFKREVGGVTAFTTGVLPPAGNLMRWEDLVGSWNDQTWTWEIKIDDLRLSKLIWFTGGTSVGVPNVGVPMLGYVRRIAAAFAEQDQSGTITLNRSLNKFIKKLWPELAKGTVNVLLGSALTAESAYTWKPSQEFVTSTDLFQDWILNTKYVGLEFNNFNALPETNPHYFELTGVALEIDKRGKY